MNIRNERNDEIIQHTP
uniref:Uncharacterized protein n=1 Tax=Arundo donax TaxID=35708 RepID=A0A0A8Y166_ARUDO